MNDKYRLVRVYERQDMRVQPINEKGEDSGDLMFSMYGDDWGYYYAIYEHVDDDWEEWGYYDQDFNLALETYNKLIEKGE